MIEEVEDGEELKAKARVSCSLGMDSNSNGEGGGRDLIWEAMRIEAKSEVNDWLIYMVAAS